MTYNDEQTISEIVSIIRDYRLGEISRPDNAHVLKWINQFLPEYRSTILAEMLNILKKRYISLENTEEAIRAHFKSQEIFGDQPTESIQKAYYLDHQLYGESQASLVKMIKRIALSDYKVSPAEKVTSSTKTFIYWDEALFSGNRIKKDLEAFVEHYDITDAKIHVIVIFSHSQGFNYLAERCFESLEQNRRVKVQLYRFVGINNSSNPRKFGTLFPSGPGQNAIVRKYCDDVIADRLSNGGNYNLFRSFEVDEDDLFTSKEGREIVEREFLRVGVELLGDYNPEEKIKPLGFSQFRGLGFGGMVVTFRNIANNCPIALWFNKEEIYTGSYSGLDWYPLFPRKYSKKRAPYTISIEELLASVRKTKNI